MNSLKIYPLELLGDNVDERPRSPQAKKAEDGEYDDDETNEVDDVVHGGSSLCFFLVLLLSFYVRRKWTQENEHCQLKSGSLWGNPRKVSSYLTISLIVTYC